MLKIFFNTKVWEVENEIPYVNGLVTNTAFKTKIEKVENKILDVSGFVANTV